MCLTAEDGGRFMINLMIEFYIQSMLTNNTTPWHDSIKNHVFAIRKQQVMLCWLYD